MFSLLIRRDGLIEPPAIGDFDVHCHLVPGLDDGARDASATLDIACMLLEMGVRKVVATPHVISDLYPNTTAAILAGVENVRRLLDAHELPLEVLAGAEYYAEPTFLARIARGDVLAWGEERHVLFESPVDQAPLVLDEIVFALKGEGYTPLLAHAERYRFLQEDHSYVFELKRRGVKLQVNHPSFLLPKTSHRGEMARWLYIKGLVDFLGTDMHRATVDGRPVPITESIVETAPRRLLPL